MTASGRSASVPGPGQTATGRRRSLSSGPPRRRASLAAVAACPAVTVLPGHYFRRVLPPVTVAEPLRLAAAGLAPAATVTNQLESDLESDSDTVGHSAGLGWPPPGRIMFRVRQNQADWH